MPNAYMGKKESRRTRLVDLLDRAGRPLRFADLVTAYSRRFSEDVGGHEALSSALGALLHSGEVRRVGRGRGIVRYRLAGHSSRSSASKRPSPATVWEVVDLAYRETNAPVSTGEIRRRLKARRAWPDRFLRLVAALDTMAVDPADVSIASVRAARSATALRRAPAAPSRGRVPGFWTPAWAPLQCAVAAPSAADALRYAIGAATREAGMPVSQRELRLWIAAQPPESWWRRELSPARTGAALRNVALRDRNREGEPDAVCVVKGPLTCHGGAPKRYAVGAPSDAALQACHITDAVTMLQLDVELESRLELSDAPFVAPIRHRLRRAREEAVRAALTSYCETVDTHAFRLARRRRARALHVVASWQASRKATGAAVATAQRIERDQELARWRATTTIVRQLALHASERASRPRRPNAAGIIGKSALLTPAEAKRGTVRAMTTPKKIAALRPAPVYAAARRFPRPGTTVRSNTRAARLVFGDELALLDIIDVWCLLQRRAEREEGASTSPIPQDLVVTVLGSVLRDAALIEALRDHPTASAASRAALDHVSKLLRCRLPF